MPAPSKTVKAVCHLRGPADFAAAFAVSAQTLARLECYASLLRRWQRAVNLVAVSTLDDVWQRHFADSAQLLALAPSAQTWLDLGSGAGFPGLVVAILLADAEEFAAPGVVTARVSLIESDTRKCAFLREVARQTGIAVDILSTRIETAATQSRVHPPEVVTARALAPLDKLFLLAAPLFSARTIGLFLKGREAAKEIEAARKRWIFDSELIPSSTQADAHIVRVSRLEPNRKEPCS